MRPSSVMELVINMSTSLLCAHCHGAVLDEDRFCTHCGKALRSSGTVAMEAIREPPSRMARADAELLQNLREATLGEYDIYGELGRGGMAVVYLAHDLALDRKVAIKVLIPALLHQEGMAERFKNEAQTAARLSHLNIIPIFAVRETDKIVYFVMKFVAGRPLDDIMEDIGASMPISMAQAILLQVGRALGHAHQAGVYHRDVKPGNILIDSDGSAVVMDFGIAKRTDVTGMTLTGTTMGTPYYMSPEQCKSEPITQAADQYSLGIVAYEMLTGSVPFDGGSAMETMSMNCYDELPSLAAARPDCPAEMVAAVHKMVEKNPANRFPSMNDAIEAMEAKPLAPKDPVRLQLMDLAHKGTDEFLARVQTPRSPVPITKSQPHYSGPVVERLKATPAPRRRKKSRGRLLGALGAAAVVGVGGGVWLSTRSPSTPSAGQVVVEGLPAGGVLFVNGERQSDTALALAPGSYVFRIVAEGFEETTDTVEVVSDSLLTLPFTGQTIPGTVIVEGLPAGGEVYLDGDPQPGSTFEARPGIHEIQLSASGYDTTVDTINLAAGGESRVTFTGDRTTVSTGTVVVQGLPPGGVVSVDGRRQSGSRFSARSGRRRIQMSAPGYSTVTQTIQVAAGRTRTVQFTGEVLPTVLWVSVFPAARVTLDGIDQGEINNRQFTVTPNRRHSLQFQRANYVTLDTTVTLQVGAVDTLRITLVQRRP
jgi:serine/threonine protein kinase